eukprot:CFRG3190T1
MAILLDPIGAAPADMPKLVTFLTVAILELAVFFEVTCFPLRAACPTWFLFHYELLSGPEHRAFSALYVVGRVDKSRDDVTHNTVISRLAFYAGFCGSCPGVLKHYNRDVPSSYLRDYFMQ